jgi:hypothetical protein
MLNTPVAVFVVLFVVVAVNSFLFFGYYLPKTTNTATAMPASSQQRTGRTPPLTTTFEATTTP